MGKIKTLIDLIKNRQFKLIIKKVIINILLFIYRIRAQIEDRQYGGISIDKKKLSRYKELGAHATESTNYIWLDKIFKAYPLNGDETFIDIGCGEGRVLTYLYSRKFRGELIGIELDPDIAATAAMRTKKCSNVKILSGNFLDHADIIKNANAVYLFNPFNAEILAKLVELIETKTDHPITLYYSNDIFRRVLDKRPNWYILRRNSIKILILPQRNYTVYRYKPAQIKPQ